MYHKGGNNLTGNVNDVFCDPKNLTKYINDAIKRIEVDCEEIKTVVLRLVVNC